jgi:sugar lactone lactonase YvrE
VYVAESGNDQVDAFVGLWNRNGGHYVGSITAGVSSPLGIWIDAAGTLYVANDGNDTVTEYPGRTGSPSLTISQGVSQPWGVAVDSHGTVYVGNMNGGYIDEYPAGSTAPSTTITGLNAPAQMVFDKADNLYVADDAGSSVDEVPFGQTKAISLDLRGLQNPVGVALDSNGDIFVSDVGPINPTDDVLVYLPGQKWPTCAVVMGGFGGNLGAPEGIALGRNGTLYVALQGNPNSYVLTFSSHGYVLRSMTSGSVIDVPHGIAIWEQKQ